MISNKITTGFELKPSMESAMDWAICSVVMIYAKRDAELVLRMPTMLPDYPEWRNNGQEWGMVRELCLFIAYYPRLSSIKNYLDY